MKKYIEFSRGEVMVEEIADKYKKIILVANLPYYITTQL